MADHAVTPVSASPISSSDMVRSFMTSGGKTLPQTAAIPEAPSSGYEDRSVRIEDLHSVEPSKSERSDQLADTETGNTAPEIKSSDIEKILVPDKSGRGKTEVEVDFSNREAIRKYVSDAHNFQSGFRKMQVERDQALKQLTNERTQIAPSKKAFDALEQAYSQRGVEGVIDLIDAKNGGFKAWERKTLEKNEFLRTATPSEREAFDARERADRYQRDMERMKTENDERWRKVETERDESEVMSMQSEVNPIFNRYNFTGKLGDKSDETYWNNVLWDQTMKSLSEEFGESGKSANKDISPETFEDEFRVHAAQIRKQLNVQVDKTVNKVVQQRKREAAENVQARVKSGYTSNMSGAREAMNKELSSGNLSSVIANWKKFGSLLSGR